MSTCVALSALDACFNAVPRVRKLTLGYKYFTATRFRDGFASFAFIRGPHLCLFVVPIRGPFGIHDGAAHVAGFYGVVHEVVKIGGVFPSLNAAFFDQFRLQFADAVGEGFVPTDVISGYILDGVELPAGFIEQSADTGQD
jgi:hypothetical protein